ncbi:MAG: hypothetical protein M0Z41_11910 [Peptococcaceae bacterium]|nr:hypothetical protein [Peptococcaceae bacterium]
MDATFIEVFTVTGRGNRQMAGVVKQGLPYRWRERRKIHFGFQTGEMVVAGVPKGKY